MKKLNLIISSLLMTMMSCRSPQNVKFDYVKISPIGNSDVPRDIFYISMAKLTNIDTTENGGMIDRVITNEKALSNIVSFVIDDKPAGKDSRQNFTEYGCLQISLYEKNSIINTYYLHKWEAQDYLNNLISLLSEKGLDSNLTNKLKEDVLAPIND